MVRPLLATVLSGVAPDCRSRNGKVGPLTERHLPLAPGLKEAAFALKARETDIVAQGDRLYLMFCKSRTEAESLPYDEIKDNQ